MAIELITGCAGKPHITPEIDALWHTTLCGGYSDGIFTATATGLSMFEATAVSDTSATIGSGLGVIQGRLYYIPNGETESVAFKEMTNSDYVRGDLVCVHLHEDTNNGTQSVELYVVTGEEQEETGVYPDVPENTSTDFYVALYNVAISQSDPSFSLRAEVIRPHVMMAEVKKTYTDVIAAGGWAQKTTYITLGSDVPSDAEDLVLAGATVSASDVDTPSVRYDLGVINAAIPADSFFESKNIRVLDFVVYNYNTSSAAGYSVFFDILYRI